MTIPVKNAAVAFEALMGRAPTDAEAERFSQQFDDVASMRQGLINSPEFTRSYTKMIERRDARMTPALIHLHIPKTAGTTLAQALLAEPNLKPEMLVHDGEREKLRTLPLAKRRRLRLIRGHMSIGIGDDFGLPFRYLCALRRPGPRIFSFYQFVKRNRKHPSYAILNEADMSFGDYLEFSVDNVAHRLELDNGQVRRLSGEMVKTSIGDERRLLKKAIHEAFSDKMILGFVEHFDDLVERLMEEGFLSQEPPEKFNVSPNSDAFDESIASLTKAQRAIYDSYIGWDQYLYEICHSTMVRSTDLAN